MKIIFAFVSVISLLRPFGALAANSFEQDLHQTKNGQIKITFIGHGTLMLEFNDKVIHIDPWTQLADYQSLPKADLILITHEHRDHLDEKAIAAIRKPETQIFCNENSKIKLQDASVLQNGDSAEALGVTIEALPAYNILHKRNEKEVFHPKGVGNAYLFNIDGKRILIGGDTENVPELKTLKNIDIAFLPMNLPYTMTPEMVADLARAMKPAILYPYHFGETDTGKLVELLKDHKEIEIRIRKLQ